MKVILSYRKIVFILLFLTGSLLYADIPKGYQAPTCGLPPVEIQEEGKFSAYWYKNSHWKPGDTIDVYFVNGTNEQKARFKHYASEWIKYANLNLNFRKDVKTDDKVAIVVKFGAIRPGVCGTSSVGYGATKMSNPSVHIDCWYSGSTIVHEMGHTLGFHHEQLNPGAKNDWIKSKAYEYFKKNYSWTPKQVDENLFNKMDDKYYDWSTFDRFSVMGYYVPGELFTDGRSLETSNNLSDGDKQAAAKLYPGRPYPEDDLNTELYVDGPVNMSLTLKDASFKLYVNDKLIESVNQDKYSYKIDLSSHFVGTKNKISFEALKNNFESEVTFSLNHQGGRYLGSYYCKGYRCSVPVKDNRVKDAFYLKKLDVNDYYGLVSYSNNKPIVKPVEKPVIKPVDNKVTKESLKKWVGKYTCPTYGNMEIKMTEGKEDALEGGYDYYGGAFWGTVSDVNGTLLKGNWILTKGNGEGSFYFQYQNEKLVGKWALQKDKNWRGDWSCTKQSSNVTKEEKDKPNLSNWAKTFDCGSYGKMTLKIKDAGKKALEGSYNFKGGYVFGSVTGDLLNVFSGQWSQSENNQIGQFRFELKDWGLQGLWRYPGEQTWRSGWNCKVK